MKLRRRGRRLNNRQNGGFKEKCLKWLAAIVGSVFFLFLDIFRTVYTLSWHLQTQRFVTFDLLLSCHFKSRFNWLQTERFTQDFYYKDVKKIKKRELVSFINLC